MSRPSPRLTYDSPTLTVEIHGDRVRITSTDSATGNYLSDWTLPASEARRMGDALIHFADQLDSADRQPVDYQPEGGGLKW
jgi:hypothetical protein